MEKISNTSTKRVVTLRKQYHQIFPTNKRQKVVGSITIIQYQYLLIKQYIVFLGMQEVRQGLQTLNITQKYISHWRWLEGVREYYSNFMDAARQMHPDYRLLNLSQPSPKIWLFEQAKKLQGGQIVKLPTNFIEYNQEKETLVLENDKKFPIKCMLMGCSEKGPEALGQFGEGMKIAMITILKQNGMDIKIESGNITYYPTLKRWNHKEMFKNQYDKKVLYIQYEPKQDEEKTRVLIRGFTKQKFDEFRYVALALLDPRKFQRINFGSSSLILSDDPILKGRIYKKGVRLQSREYKQKGPQSELTYDSDQIMVGRDRDCINNLWDVYNIQSLVLYKVCCLVFDEEYLQENPRIRQELLPKLIDKVYQYLRDGNLQTYYFRNHMANNKALADIFYQKFMAEANKDFETDQLYASYRNIRAINTQLQKYGIPNAFYPIKQVGSHLYPALIHSTKYLSVQTKIQQQIKSLQARPLTDNESQRIDQIKIKAAELFPEINQYQFKVKNFYNLVCYKEGRVVYIGESQLADPANIMRAIIRF